MDDLAGPLTGDKAALRTALRRRRAGLPAPVRRQAEAAIQGHLGELVARQAPRCLLVYEAHGDEVKLQPLVSSWLDAGLTVAWPRVDPDRGLTLHVLDDLAGLIPGYRGILEPQAHAPLVTPADVELALVPGVGFDRGGGRLGQGGGHYDRLLIQLSGARRIGVAFGIQVVPCVPMGEHDVSMELLVTEDGANPCGSES